MKLRCTIWLQVCLYLSLSVGAVNTLWAAAAAAGGDIPASMRGSEEVNRRLETSTATKTDVQILEHARAANEDVYSSLQSFVCQEEINRFKGNLSGHSVHALDNITAKLSFERGIERYTEVLQNKRSRPGMSSIRGAWSEGEFGTLLLQTEQLVGTKNVDFESFADIKNEPAAIYHFDVGSEESPWDLTVGGKHYRLPFRTTVWISVSTGEILKIDRTTLSVAAETHVSKINWGITLAHVSLNGKPWLLPESGTYAVVYNESRQREWNLISFSGYQRYGSQTALKFE